MKGKNIIIVVLILIIVLLLGYITYDKLLNVETKKTGNKTSEELKKEEENIEEVSDKLIDKIEKYKLYLLSDDEEVNVSDELSDIQIRMLYFYLMDNNKKVTKENVDEYIDSLYGQELPNYPDIPLAGAKYNIEKDEYDINPVGHDAMEIKPVIVKKENIKNNDEQYIITVTFVYAPSQGLIETPENSFYADSKFSVKLTELDKFARTDIDGSPAEANISGAKDYYNAHYGEFKEISPKYKYTFEKSDNNFYLTKYEVSK